MTDYEKNRTDILTAMGLAILAGENYIHTQKAEAPIIIESPLERELNQAVVNETILGHTSFPYN